MTEHRDRESTGTGSGREGSGGVKGTGVARRILRGLGIGLLALIGLAVLVAVLLCLHPVRRSILRHALPRAADYVPGDLTIEEARWPSLGTFEFEGVAWSADGATLLKVDTLSISLILWPLTAGDIKARTAVAHGLTADVPRIAALFPPDTTAAVKAQEPGQVAGGFPRPGAIPGLPSIAIDSISVKAPLIKLSEGNALEELVFVGSFDFASGGSGRVRVVRLGVAGEGGGFKVDDLSLDANLREGTLEGKGSGSYAGGQPIVFSAESSAPDEVAVMMARERGLRPPKDPGVAALIRFEREDGRVVGMSFDLDLRTPSAEEFAAWGTLPGGPQALLPPESVNAEASGAVTFEPEFGVTARCVVREPSRLKRGMAAFTYRDQVAVVDSLSLAFPQGVTLCTAARIGIGDEIRADLETLHLRAAGSCSGWRPSGQRPGRVSYSTRTRGLRIEGLRIAGDYGEMTVDGLVDARGAGSVEITAAWPEPPAPLYKLLADEPGLADSLRAAWAADAPYSLRAAVTLLGDESGIRITGNARLRLPGPRALAPLLPAGAETGGLGPVLGDMGFEFAQGDTLTGAPAEFELAMDLSRTEWMDTASVRLKGSGDSITVDEFVIHAGQLRAVAAGALNKVTRAGFARAAVSDAGFLRHFSGAVPDMDIVMEAEFAGGADGFRGYDIEARLSGELAGQGYHIPSIAGTLAVDASGTRARVSLPQGMVTDHAQIDIAEADFASLSATGVFPARVALTVAGGEYDYRQRMDLALGDTVICDVDTLKIAAYGGDLEASGPFRMAFVRDTGAFSIDRLNLAGSLGEITAYGHAGPQGVSLTCRAAVDLPERPPPGLKVPRGAWPRRFRADLDVPAADEFRLDAEVEGFVLDDGNAAALAFTIAGSDTGVSSTVSMESGGARLLDGSLFLPAGITTYPPGLAYRGGAVSIALRLEGYPLLVQEKSAGRGYDNLVARVDADVRIGGTARSPAAYLSAVMRFPDWPDMADFSVGAAAALRPDSLGDPDLRRLALELDRRVATVLGVDRTETLAAEFALRRGERPLLSGSLTYPVIMTFDPFHFGVSDGGMHAVVSSDGLPLEDIDVFLPEGIGLNGTLQVQLAARGPADDPEMSGDIGLRSLDVKYGQLASLLMEGDLKVGGNARKPSVVGDIAIQGGTISLPEKAREMHPVDGPAMLLDLTWRPGADSVQAAITLEGPARKSEMERPAFEADYDISLDIQHGFWLRGEGLEIELEGELQVTQNKGLPVISGDINARRGTFLFLGRVFDLERGVISFYGQPEINPSLDLIVASNIESYRVFIRLGGTLEKPELTLTSDPDLPEGDIVAMIVFGKPLDSLNEGQGDMLKERTSDIVVQMGAAKLQQSLAGQGGIDVVSVRSARGEGDQGSALVVGKYITPDLLVSYEQALKEKSTSYIVMEYMLTRYIKLETLYSNQSKTGLGLGVEKNY